MVGRGCGVAGRRTRSAIGRAGGVLRRSCVLCWGCVLRWGLVRRTRRLRSGGGLGGRRTRLFLRRSHYGHRDKNQQYGPFRHDVLSSVVQFHSHSCQMRSSFLISPQSTSGEHAQTNPSVQPAVPLMASSTRASGSECHGGSTGTGLRSSDNFTPVSLRCQAISQNLHLSPRTSRRTRKLRPACRLRAQRRLPDGELGWASLARINRMNRRVSPS